MTPALVPIPPKLFKAILEKAGYVLDEETELNWTLIKLGSSCPVINLPKEGGVVSISVMMGTLDKIKMDNKTYFDFLEQINKP